MVEHVLIIRLSAIGDVAMTVPVVVSAARQYPHVRFTVLSRPFARPLFEDIEPNLFFMGADVKGEYHGIHGLNKLYRRLMAKNFTAIADFHDVLRTKYVRSRFNFSFTDNIRVAHINKHRAEKKELCSYNNKVKHQLPTSFHNYCEVLAELGYPVKLDFQSIFKQKPSLTDLIKSVPQLGNFIPPLRGLGGVSSEVSAGPLIGIAPFAAHYWKIYPLGLMEEVIRLLIESHPDCHIFFFGGGKGEMLQFDQWAEKYPQCINASAILGGLANELKLMANLDVMLSMDSGNMHLASITGCPVVSVWGATHPFAGFAPWNQSPEDEVQTDLPCRPCSVYGNKKCRRGDFACMRNITPEMIVSTINHHL